MKKNQKLGIKVFYYYLSKRISIGIVFFAISFILSSLKTAMVSKLVFVFPLITSINIVNYFVNGLFIISTLLVVFSLVTSWLSYISCDFTLGEESFSSRKGILNKKEVFIPYKQIQNINIEQSFNFKMMGVSKLRIETAGNDNNNGGQAEGNFEVVDSKVAQTIREFILEKINRQQI